MKKQSVAQGTLILVVAGLITKVLGMVNRVILTRLLGEDGIGIYMLIAPTLMLVTTFASIGLPIAIPTLISRANERQKKSLIRLIDYCYDFKPNCQSYPLLYCQATLYGLAKGRTNILTTYFNWSFTVLRFIFNHLKGILSGRTKHVPFSYFNTR